MKNNFIHTDMIGNEIAMHCHKKEKKIRVYGLWQGLWQCECGAVYCDYVPDKWFLSIFDFQRIFAN